MSGIFSFQGRSSISQYWVMTLVLSAISVVAFIATAIFAAVSLALGTINFLENLTGEQSAFRIAPSWIILLLLWAGYIVIATWLWLAVTARRLRDAGWNPWLTILVFSPAFGLVGAGIQILATFLLSPDTTSEASVETWLIIWSVLMNLLALISFVAWIVFGCIGSKK